MRRTWEKGAPGASSPDENTHRPNRHPSFLSWPLHSPHQHPETERSAPALKGRQSHPPTTPESGGVGTESPCRWHLLLGWQVGAGDL